MFAFGYLQGFVWRLLEIPNLSSGFSFPPSSALDCTSSSLCPLSLSHPSLSRARFPLTGASARGLPRELGLLPQQGHSQRVFLYSCTSRIRAVVKFCSSDPASFLRTRTSHRCPSHQKQCSWVPSLLVPRLSPVPQDVEAAERPDLLANELMTRTLQPGPASGLQCEEQDPHQ